MSGESGAFTECHLFERRYIPSFVAFTQDEMLAGVRFAFIPFRRSFYPEESLGYALNAEKIDNESVSKINKPCTDRLVYFIDPKVKPFLSYA